MNNSTTHHKRKWRTFGAVVVVCFAAFLLGLSVLQIYQARAVSGWPTVTGTITKVEIEKDKSRSDIYPRYDAKVVYEYIVNGERLIGKSIRLLPVGSKYESELKWVEEQYPVASQHEVYYMASNPSIACLRYDTGIGHYIAVVACFFLVVAGLWDLSDFVRSKL